MFLPPPAVSVTVQTTTYNGQPAYAISNEAARLVVSPSLGRVVEFGMTGGPNVLWQAPTGEFAAKGYRNLGGDKVWYAPQTLWNWPPDPSWDGAAFTAQLLPDGVRLVSERGTILPLRLTRTIRLDPYAPKVSFLNSLANEGLKPVTVGLWQVTQVSHPTEIRLSTQTTAAQPKGYAMLQNAFDKSVARENRGFLSIHLHPTQSFKYGAKGGDGTLTADVARFRLSVFSPIARRARYADGDSAKQVYTAPESTGYAELESLAPLETLEPHQVQQQSVTWRLSPL